MEPYLSAMQARMDHEERLRLAADRRLARTGSRGPRWEQRIVVAARRFRRGADGGRDGAPTWPASLTTGTARTAWRSGEPWCC